MSVSTSAPDAGIERALTIRVDERDNVAIVVNDFGLPAGSALACGIVLVLSCRKGTRLR